jgi:hypothetical protein
MLIAVSEQGLFFWLFWRIVDQMNGPGVEWRERLKAAAMSIGLRHPEEVIKFHEQWYRLLEAGYRTDEKRTLRKSCLRIAPRHQPEA